MSMVRNFIVVIFIFASLFFGYYFVSLENRSKSIVMVDEVDLLAQAQNNKIEEKYQYEELEIPILIYHQIRDWRDSDSLRDRNYIVPPKDFERQMKYLKENGFTSISMDRIHDYLGEGYSEPLPEKPIIITFDDGVINQYNNAFSVLVENHLMATFFVFTNAISQNENYFTWEKLNEMLEAGMEIGSHTHLHPNLMKVGLDRQVKEIADSKRILEENLGISINSIAYPFGVYDKGIIKLVKDSGYKQARGIFHGKVHDKENIFHLKGRFITSDFKSFKNFIN